MAKYQSVRGVLPLSRSCIILWLRKKNKVIISHSLEFCKIFYHLGDYIKMDVHMLHVGQLCKDLLNSLINS